jgi:hypothetical protein
VHSYALADRIFEWWKEGVFASCLPTSLRKLRIPGYSIDRTTLRGVLDAVRAGRLPHLARVEITAQTYQDPLEEEPELWREDKEYVQLAEDFDGAGLALVAHHIEFPDESWGEWDLDEELRQELEEE